MIMSSVNTLRRHNLGLKLYEFYCNRSKFSTNPDPNVMRLFGKGILMSKYSRYRRRLFPETYEVYNIDTNTLKGRRVDYYLYIYILYINNRYIYSNI